MRFAINSDQQLEKFTSYSILTHMNAPADNSLSKQEHLRNEFSAWRCLITGHEVLFDPRASNSTVSDYKD